MKYQIQIIASTQKSASDIKVEIEQALKHLRLVIEDVKVDKYSPSTVRKVVRVHR